MTGAVPVLVPLRNTSVLGMFERIITVPTGADSGRTLASTISFSPATTVTCFFQIG